MYSEDGLVDVPDGPFKGHRCGESTAARPRCHLPRSRSPPLSSSSPSSSSSSLSFVLHPCLGRPPRSLAALILVIPLSSPHPSRHAPPSWAEPSKTSLRAAMRAVVADPAEAATRGRKARADMVSRQLSDRSRRGSIPVLLLILLTHPAQPSCSPCSASCSSSKSSSSSTACRRLILTVLHPHPR